MKWLIVNTDYDEFLAELYAQRPGLAEQPYAEQLRVRYATRFGTADFYSHNLRALGHEAADVFPNNPAIQARWAKENGVPFRGRPGWRIRWRRGAVPWPTRIAGHEWLYDTLAAQIRAYRPDVLYCMAAEEFGTGFLRRVRGCYRLAVVQHAAGWPEIDLTGYDLGLSSLPNLVERFRTLGLKAEYFRLGFEQRVLEDLNGAPRSIDVAFVGGLVGVHDLGARVLEELSGQCDVRVYGYGSQHLSPDSPLRTRCRGPLFGREMFSVLHRSRIVFNRHSRVAEQYANNMRLYETTGVGAMLLTDQKDNLAELFTPGVEVVAYRDAEECVRLVRHYLEHEAEREAIARAGQARTLREHTYAQRMRELVEIVGRYL